MLGGYDTGAWLLAGAGLLTDRSATLHWLEQDAFREEFLDVRLLRQKFVIDGNRLTAGGAAGVMALTLDLIGRQAGDTLVFDVADMFAHGIEPQRRIDLDPDRLAPPHHSPSLRRAIVEMRRGIEDPRTLREVAEAAAVSERTLNRLFHAELGISAGKYYQTVRLSLALTLAQETRLPLSEIAAHTGFSSAATLSRAYAAHFGFTIRDTRRKTRAPLAPTARRDSTARAIRCSRFASIVLIYMKTFGGAKGDRTPDLLHAMQALSQLSYGPGSQRKPRASL